MFYLVSISWHNVLGEKPARGFRCGLAVGCACLWVIFYSMPEKAVMVQHRTPLTSQKKSVSLHCPLDPVPQLHLCCGGKEQGLLQDQFCLTPCGSHCSCVQLNSEFTDFSHASVLQEIERNISVNT